MKAPSLRTAAILLVFAAALPVAAAALRAERVPGCARDGVAVDGLFAVRVGTAAGDPVLCSVRCAEAWLVSRGDADHPQVQVRAAEAGEWIDLGTATLVRSTVVASKATGERIHAFRDAAAAEAHVKAYGGLILAGPDRPFRARR